MEIKPIRTEADYENALVYIEQLWDAIPGSPEGNRLDVLVTLVEDYEEKTHPIPPADPIETILHYMESKGLSKSDLEPYIGSNVSVLEILNRERTLSLEMIRNLHKGLGIPADILVQPYALKTASS